MARKIRKLYKVTITRVGLNPIVYYVRDLDKKQAIYKAMEHLDKNSYSWEKKLDCSVQAETMNGHYLLR